MCDATDPTTTVQRPRAGPSFTMNINSFRLLQTRSRPPILSFFRLFVICSICLFCHYYPLRSELTAVRHWHLSYCSLNCIQCHIAMLSCCFSFFYFYQHRRIFYLHRVRNRTRVQPGHYKVGRWGLSSQSKDLSPRSIPSLPPSPSRSNITAIHFKSKEHMQTMRD